MDGSIREWFSFIKFNLILFVITAAVYSFEVEDVTQRVFENSGSQINGVLAAFGDFNSDKLTDLFFITEQGGAVSIIFANEKEPIFRTKSITSCRFIDVVITSVVPGDYNGDSKMDVLLTIQKPHTKSNRTEIWFLEGNITELVCEKQRLNGINTDIIMDVQPLVLDYNGDMIPDLYGETEEGIRTVWIMKHNWTVQVENVTSTLNRIRQTHSNAFVNLNNDVTSDVFVTTGNKQFEVWLNENGAFYAYKTFNFTNPGKNGIIGQSAFLDLDLDGYLDHIVPICFDFPKCTNASIYLQYGPNKTEWLPLTGVLIPSSEPGSHEWGFYQEESYPINLRIGDYNLDGYPDLLTILQYNETTREAVVLENTACRGCLFSRRFQVKRPFRSVKNVSLAAFYDIYQDGNLDFLFISQNGSNYKITALLNKLESDVCFLKIMVLSGLLYPSAKNKVKAYGDNQPGPFLFYETTQLDGSPQKSCAAQLSQSAHFSLQLPYTVFGLGQTPNFVDELTVGIPQSSQFNKEECVKTWKSIIPNSQMIIIPLRDEETKQISWYSLLFVTPSHQVLITFIALIGTCIFIILIIGGLYWKEKIADKKERLQEAHKFHFDAM